MEHKLLVKLGNICKEIFDDYVAIHYVEQDNEEEEYYKRYLIIIFAKRAPRRVYVYDSEFSIAHFIDEIRYLL